MTYDASFYFANLSADVARCINATRAGNEARYEDSLARAYQTLRKVRDTKRYEAYEEGLLMLRGLALARGNPTALTAFKDALDGMILKESHRDYPQRGFGGVAQNKRV